MQGHGICQVIQGLLPRPLLHDVADAEQEHDAGCRVKVALRHRNRDRGRIQDVHVKPPLSKGLQCLKDKRNRPDDADCHPDGCRQEEADCIVSEHMAKHPVHVLVLDFSSRVLRDFHLAVVIVERGKSLDHGFPDARLLPVEHGRICGPLRDLRIQYPQLCKEIVLDDVRLVNGHAALMQMHPHSSAGLMQDSAPHALSAFSFSSASASATSALASAISCARSAAARFALMSLASALMSSQFSLRVVKVFTAEPVLPCTHNQVSFQVRCLLLLEVMLI